MAVFFTLIASRVLSFPKGYLCPVKALYYLLSLPACYLDPSGVTCLEKPWLNPRAHETPPAQAPWTLAGTTSSDAEILWCISPRCGRAWFQVAIQAVHQLASNDQVKSKMVGL